MSTWWRHRGPIDRNDLFVQLNCPIHELLFTAFYLRWSGRKNTAKMMLIVVVGREEENRALTCEHPIGHTINSNHSLCSIVFWAGKELWRWAIELKSTRTCRLSAQNNLQRPQPCDWNVNTCKQSFKRPSAGPTIIAFLRATHRDIFINIFDCVAAQSSCN